MEQRHSIIPGSKARTIDFNKNLYRRLLFYGVLLRNDLSESKGLFNHYLHRLTVCGAFLSLLCSSFASAAQAQTGGEPQLRARLESTIRQLTGPTFKGRAFKTEGGRKAAEFIASQFRDAGLKPGAERGEFLQPIGGGGQNVVGLLPGHKDEFVLVGAHYDAFGGQFPGAMDNAAGVALMIELARVTAKNPPQRGVLFIAFDGGEQDNAGAKFYAGHPLMPLGQMAAAINLSGFGGGMSEQLYETLYVTGAEFSPQLAQAVTKYKRGDAYLALIGSDATRFFGGEHFNFSLKQTPAITISNGVHYAYHSKMDTTNRINFAALEKHVAALAKVTAEIANTPGKIERQSDPFYDADEAAEWVRVLSALRENVIKVSANAAGQAKIDEALLELKRFKGSPVQDAKAREAVILRAASICFYISNPNGVEFNSLLDAARAAEQRGDRQQAIAAYQKLLKFIEEEYRRDDQTVSNIRQKLDRVHKQ